jgi:hypothetical protein
MLLFPRPLVGRGAPRSSSDLNRNLSSGFRFLLAARLLLEPALPFPATRRETLATEAFGLQLDNARLASSLKSEAKMVIGQWPKTAAFIRFRSAAITRLPM